mmetsp:Transcript_7270/g.17464  ORF Transcript_7270/g.17464 Transcript_7270/m.17464 type:complete len:239 (-) Transcript_7270:629-1345(-)
MHRARSSSVCGSWLPCIGFCHCLLGLHPPPSLTIFFLPFQGTAALTLSKTAITMLTQLPLSCSSISRDRRACGSAASVKTNSPSTGTRSPPSGTLPSAAAVGAVPVRVEEQRDMEVLVDLAGGDLKVDGRLGVEGGQAVDGGVLAAHRLHVWPRLEREAVLPRIDSVGGFHQVGDAAVMVGGSGGDLLPDLPLTLRAREPPVERDDEPGRRPPGGCVEDMRRDGRHGRLGRGTANSSC